MPGETVGVSGTPTGGISQDCEGKKESVVDSQEVSESGESVASGAAVDSVGEGEEGGETDSVKEGESEEGTAEGKRGEGETADDGDTVSLLLEDIVKSVVGISDIRTGLACCPGSTSKCNTKGSDSGKDGEGERDSEAGQQGREERGGESVCGCGEALVALGAICTETPALADLGLSLCLDTLKTHTHCTATIYDAMVPLEAVVELLRNRDVGVTVPALLGGAREEKGARETEGERGVFKTVSTEQYLLDTGILESMMEVLVAVEAEKTYLEGLDPMRGMDGVEEEKEKRPKGERGGKKEVDTGVTHSKAGENEAPDVAADSNTEKGKGGEDSAEAETETAISEGEGEREAVAETMQCESEADIKTDNAVEGETEADGEGEGESNGDTTGVGETDTATTVAPGLGETVADTISEGQIEAETDTEGAEPQPEGETEHKTHPTVGEGEEVGEGESKTGADLKRVTGTGLENEGDMESHPNATGDGKTETGDGGGGSKDGTAVEEGDMGGTTGVGDGQGDATAGTAAEGERETETVVAGVETETKPDTGVGVEGEAGTKTGKPTDGKEENGSESQETTTPVKGKPEGEGDKKSKVSSKKDESPAEVYGVDWWSGGDVVESVQPKKTREVDPARIAALLTLQAAGYAAFDLAHFVIWNSTPTLNLVQMKQVIELSTQFNDMVDDWGIVMLSKKTLQDDSCAMLFEAGVLPALTAEAQREPEMEAQIQWLTRRLLTSETSTYNGELRSGFVPLLHKILKMTDLDKKYQGHRRRYVFSEDGDHRFDDDRAETLRCLNVALQRDTVTNVEPLLEGPDSLPNLIYSVLEVNNKSPAMTTKILGEAMYVLWALAGKVTSGRAVSILRPAIEPLCKAYYMCPKLPKSVQKGGFLIADLILDTAQRVMQADLSAAPKYLPRLLMAIKHMMHALSKKGGILSWRFIRCAAVLFNLTVPEGGDRQSRTFDEKIMHYMVSALTLRTSTAGLVYRLPIWRLLGIWACNDANRVGMNSRGALTHILNHCPYETTQDRLQWYTARCTRQEGRHSLEALYMSHTNSDGETYVTVSHPDDAAAVAEIHHIAQMLERFQKWKGQSLLTREDLERPVTVGDSASEEDWYPLGTCAPDSECLSDQVQPEVDEDETDLSLEWYPLATGF
ncbi:hypothetical protein KIPB_003112 [Kipferlia bialata]|uniref:Uncharacterized protein n=1 Tax=Kipferlia bialata TaxID=797122 RepID=A0A9K3CTE8_9EUKA|nr:hypothetical protein KIPB_003112 [Kipferlia bialata]|eukprot:g3112.t1